jgi:hypothetical protein
MRSAGQSVSDVSVDVNTGSHSGRQVKTVGLRPGIVENIMHNLRERAIIDYESLVDPVRDVQKEIARSTEAYVIYYGERPGALWGVMQESILDDTAEVWSVTTPIVNLYPVAFGRETRRLLKVLLERYRVLCGIVDAQYDCSIRWLQWLGFDVLPPFKQNKLLLRRFEMRRV